MSSNGKLIGLIGGVGPWAGLDVHRKILEECRYEQEQECVSVLHLSYPGKYTDRTDYILGKVTTNPAYSFIEELHSLETSGVDVAAIVCNTAHAAPILRVMSSWLENSSLQYINIIEETQHKLKQDGIRTVGLLATQGTYSFGLYTDGFSGNILHPATKTQERIHAVIYDRAYGLKTHFPQTTAKQLEDLRNAASELMDCGAEALVLGCTELPLLENYFNDWGYPVYDPNRILAQRLVEACIGPPTLEKRLINDKQHI